MLSNLTRIGALVGSTALLAVAVASAQDRKAVESGGRTGVAVFNSVEGRTTVLSIRPDGARVEKGDIVCELDPAEVQDRLVNQEIVVRGAEADVQGARLAREVAVIAATEYMRGIFVQEKAVTGTITAVSDTEVPVSKCLDFLNVALRPVDAIIPNPYAPEMPKAGQVLKVQDLNEAMRRNLRIFQGHDPDAIPISTAHGWRS